MGAGTVSTATIRDVAQKAGVSQSTVSRVLNNTGYVSAGTRARVMQAVESLDYSPSAIAVSLSKSRSRIIGVVVPQIFAPFFSELFYTADKIAEQYDYRLLLCNSDASVERERRLIDDLLSYKIAALFITPVDGPGGSNAEYLNSIRRSGIPVVCVDREPAGIACDGVYIDNFGACYEATREVLARGWRNIAYMADPPVYAPGRQRLRAFETACAEFGVQVPPENRMLAPIEAWRERGAFLEEIVHRKNPPKAIINFSKGWDASMLRTITAAGLRVPEDIFLTGLDDDGALQAYGYYTDYAPGTPAVAIAAAELLMERARCTGPLPEPVRKVLATHMRAVLKPGTKLPAAEVPPDPAKTTRQG
ncbi:LacI family DNA-binding transcriptional regulator [Hominenteromicrobium sp.]|jgi:LacI family transcriptional regulator|nr:LacI family transcriptional regulator [Candidatus Ruminococcus gallistercoris]